MSICLCMCKLCPYAQGPRCKCDDAGCGGGRGQSSLHLDPWGAWPCHSGASSHSPPCHFCTYRSYYTSRNPMSDSPALRGGPNVAQRLMIVMAAVPVTIMHAPLLFGTGVPLLTQVRVKPRARRLMLASGYVVGFCFLCDFLSTFALTATSRVGTNTTCRMYCTSRHAQKVTP